MSTFTKCAAPTTTGSCDPTKHVNYNLGIVIGADDFNQEFSYLSGRDRWMARDSIGYGTVSGLLVSLEPLDVKGPRVVVSPGVAVSSCGQMIRVPTAQCAYLNDWLKLDTTTEELIGHAGSPPTSVRAYVVLCYRDCPTDNVPIPGEPCRSEDDLMAASRLADDFTLELRLDPPSQTEEDAVRRFVGWLHQVGVTDVPADATPLEEFLGALRGANALPDPTIAIRPISPALLKIPADQMCSYLRAAFRVWVTELRPQWRADLLSNWQGCCGHSGSGDVPQEECVLLAEVDVPILIPSGGGDWQVDDHAQITVDEDRRPYLIHSRMLQEWILCGGGRGAIGPTGAAGPTSSVGPAGAARGQERSGPAGVGIRGPVGPPDDSFIIAAGRFDSNGNAAPAPLFSFNLTASRLSSTLPLFLLTFPGFSPTGRFVVKGTLIASANLAGMPFEVIPPTDPVVVNIPNVNSGIIVRTATVQQAVAPGFMVEISQFPVNPNGATNENPTT